MYAPHPSELALELESAGEYAKMANSPDIMNGCTDHFDIGSVAKGAQAKRRRRAECGGVLMTGEFIDPAGGHYSLLIGSDRS